MAAKNFHVKNGLSIGTTEVINSSGLIQSAALGSDFNEKVDDRVNALIVAGTGISTSYDDSAGTLTINGQVGDITGVTAGDGLTGGGSSGDITVSLDSSVAGDGLAHSSGVLSVGVDDSSIETNSDALRIKASGVTNAMLAGSIANAKLANSSITVSDGSNSTATALGGTITFAAGEGMDVAESSGTVTFSGEDASDSNKGIASFDATDFSVSSGDVTIQAERIQDIVGAMVTGNTESGITVTYEDGDGTLDFSTTLGSLSGTTDNITEGSTNLFHTNERVDDRVNALLQAGTNMSLSYDDAANTLTISSSGKTQEEIEDIVGGQLVTNGSHTNITASYDDANDGAIDLSITDATIRGKVSVTDAGGDGSLAYDNGTGVITYTGPSASEVRAHISGGTGVTVSSGEIAIGQAVATGSNVTFADVAATGNVTITGNLDVNGTTTTLDTTNSTIADRLIELGTGTTGTPANDMGIVLERGSSDNAFIGWDESADKFLMGTGSFTGASTGDLTVTTGTLVANLEGNVTGNVTGNVSGSAGSATGNAATATALETARNIGGVSFDGTANINLPGVNTAGNQDTTGNAATATALETARTINGVSFDGSSNITTLTAGTGVSVSGTAVSIGQAVATNSNVTFNQIHTDYASNSGQVARNIYQSTSAPGGSDGQVGDLWILYS